MLVILSGVAGAGKDTIIKAITKKMSNVCTVPSYTTRAPRADDIEGVSYYFVSKETLVTFKVSCKDKVIAYFTSSNKFSSSIPSYKRGAKLRKTSSSKIS